MGDFIERKRRLDGTELTFDCDRVDVNRRRAICVYRSTGTFKTPHFTMHEGTLSFGFFWTRRPYILYRITDPDGTVAGYRFDVVDDVRIADGGVSYRDLIIDVWVSPEGCIEIEDEDELAEAVGTGAVDPGVVAEAERGRDLIARNYRRIVAEVEAELVAWWPPGAASATRLPARPATPRTRARPEQPR